MKYKVFVKRIAAFGLALVLASSSVSMDVIAASAYEKDVDTDVIDGDDIDHIHIYVDGICECGVAEITEENTDGSGAEKSEEENLDGADDELTEEETPTSDEEEEILEIFNDSTEIARLGEAGIRSISIYSGTQRLYFDVLDSNKLNAHSIYFEYETTASDSGTINIDNPAFETLFDGYSFTYQAPNVADKVNAFYQRVSDGDPSIYREPGKYWLQLYRNDSYGDVDTIYNVGPFNVYALSQLTTLPLDYEVTVAKSKEHTIDFMANPLTWCGAVDLVAGQRYTMFVTPEEDPTAISPIDAKLWTLDQDGHGTFATDGGYVITCTERETTFTAPSTGRFYISAFANQQCRIRLKNATGITSVTASSDTDTTFYMGLDGIIAGSGHMLAENFKYDVTTYDGTSSLVEIGLSMDDLRTKSGYSTNDIVKPVTVGGVTTYETVTVADARDDYMLYPGEYALMLQLDTQVFYIPFTIVDPVYHEGVSPDYSIKDEFLTDGTPAPLSGDSLGDKAIYRRVYMEKDKTYKYSFDYGDTYAEIWLNLYDTEARHVSDYHRDYIYKAPKTGYYYCKINISGQANLSIEEIIGIESIEVNRLPDRTKYYPGTEISLNGLELNFTFTNGTAQTFSPERTNNEWYQYITEMAARCTTESLLLNTFDDECVGKTFNLELKISGYGTYTVPGYTCTVCDYSSATSIDTDQNISVPQNAYPVIVNPGYTYNLYDDPAVYTMDLTAGNTYYFTGTDVELRLISRVPSDDGSYYIYDSANYGRLSVNFAYTAPKDVSAYILAYSTTSNGSFKVLNGLPYKGIYLNKGIQRGDYVLPFNRPYLYDAGIELMLEKEDGSIDYVEVDSSEKLRDKGIICVTKDINGRSWDETANDVPAGTYYYIFYFGDTTSPMYCETSRFEVKEPTIYGSLNEGQSINVSGHFDGEPYFFKTYLEAGKVYSLHRTTPNYSNGEEYLWGINTTWYCEKFGLERFIVDRSGYYYMSVSSTTSNTFTLKAGVQITNVEVVKDPRTTDFYMPTDTCLLDKIYYNTFATQPYGMEVKISYADGTSEVVPYSNYDGSRWNELGLNVGYYMVNAGVEKQLWGGDTITVGSYRWKITCFDESLPGYTGSPIKIDYNIQASKLLVPAERQTPGDGTTDTLDIPACGTKNQWGGYEESSNIYIKLDLEKGKTYAITSTSDSRMDLYINGYQMTTYFNNSAFFFTPSGPYTVWEGVWVPSKDRYEQISHEVTPSADDVYYLRIVTDEDTTVHIEESDGYYGTPYAYKSIEDRNNNKVISNTNKLEFTYGVDTPSLDGVYVYLSGTSENPYGKLLVLHSGDNGDLEDRFVATSVEVDAGGVEKTSPKATKVTKVYLGSASGKPIVYDSYGNLEMGDYYWDIELAYLNGNSSVYRDGQEYVYIPFSVKGVASNYTVTFDDNRDKLDEALASKGLPTVVKGKTRTQLVKKNTYVALNANAYTCAGYEFVGWSDKPLAPFASDKTIDDIRTIAADANIYADRQKVNNLAAQVGDNGDITAKLYVIWREKPYTISYHLGKEVGIPGAWDSSYSYDMASPIVLPNKTAVDGIVSGTGSYTLGGVTYSGYKFDGWYMNSSYTGIAVDKIAPGTYGDIHLYAKWMPDSIEVVFNSTGGSGVMESQDAYYDQPLVLNKNRFSKRGYAFAGWTVIDPSLWNTTDKSDDYYITNLVTNYGFMDGAAVDCDARIFNAEASDPIKSAVTVDGENKTLKLYAVWQSSFAIEYEMDTVRDRTVIASVPSESDIPDSYKSYEAGDVKVLPEPEMEGYTFAGWYESVTYDASGIADFDGYVDIIDRNMARNLKLYARWEPDVYVLKLDANGGNGRQVNVAMETDKPYSLPLNTYTKPGYRFIGWVDANNKHLKESGILTSYANMAKSESEILTQLSVAYPGYTFYEDGAGGLLNMQNELSTNVLYAVWAVNSDTYTLHTDGGTISPALVSSLGLACTEPANTYTGNYTYTSSMLMGAKMLPTADDMSKLHYAFDGWYTESTYKNKVTSTNKLMGDVDLYAKWTVDNYKIAFHINSTVPGATGTMPYMICSGQDNKALVGNAFTVPGYTFMGWATAPTSNVKYLDKQIIAKPNASDMVLDGSGEWIYNLYAVWAKKGDTRYNITYKTGDTVMNPAWFDVTDSNYTSTYVFGSATNLPTPYRKNFTFQGWYTDERMTNRVYSIPGNSYGDITLYAKWSGDQYKIVFQPNVPDGSKLTGNAKTEMMTYGDAKALTTSPFRIKGYTLMGWALSEGGPVVYANAEKLALIEGMPAWTYANNMNNVLNLYAVWSQDTYNINYELGIAGASMPTAAPTTYYSYTGGVVLAEPYKMGYTFVGWYSDAALRKKVTKISNTATGDKTFFAKWVANTR